MLTISYRLPLCELAKPTTSYNTNLKPNPLNLLKEEPEI